MPSAIPKVRTYPVCSECKAPYVLRRAWLIQSNTEEWIWQRDCKHKKAVPLVNTAIERAEALKDGGVEP
jgi:hypothetical protein